MVRNPFADAPLAAACASDLQRLQQNLDALRRGLLGLSAGVEAARRHALETTHPRPRPDVIRVDPAVLVDREERR